MPVPPVSTTGLLLDCGLLAERSVASVGVCGGYHVQPEPQMLFLGTYSSAA